MGIDSFSKIVKIFYMKYLWMLLSICLVACNTTKSVVKRQDDAQKIKGYQKYNPVTGKYEWVSEDPEMKKDSIDLAELQKKNAAKAAAKADKGFNRAIKVALILPFYADQSKEGEAIYAKSKWAINFYGGVQLALDTLSQKGISVDLRVLDDKASEAELQKMLLFEDVKNADLIIGPAGKANLKIAANFAKTKGIPLVSPYSSNDDITTNNPYFIQLNPSLKSHCERIIEDVYTHHKNPNLTIISRNKPTETATYEYFTNHINKIYSNNLTTRKISVDEELVGISKTDFSNIIVPNRQNVILIPSWSNEAFLSALLQKIESLRKGSEVYVYGMPQWVGFELLSMELLDKLQVKITTVNPFEVNKAQAKVFKKKYFQKFSGLAEEEALLGFDLTFLLVELLHKYGKEMISHLDAKKLNGIATTYDFDQVTSSTLDKVNPKTVQRYENKSIYILKSEQGVYEIKE